MSKAVSGPVAHNVYSPTLTASHLAFKTLSISSTSVLSLGACAWHRESALSYYVTVDNIRYRKMPSQLSDLLKKNPEYHSSSAHLSEKIR